MLAVCLAKCRGSRLCFWNPPGLGWVIFLGESQCRIYSNICAKFGCGPTVVSKRGGDRHTDKGTLQLYIVDGLGRKRLESIIEYRLLVVLHWFGDVAG